MANSSSALCANCAHVHPAVTLRGTTRILVACDHDGCACTAFRFGKTAGKAPGQLDSNDTPGHALALENAALKEHVQQLRQRVPVTDATFTTEEVQALRQDAAHAHAEMTRTRMEHATLRRELQRINAQLTGAISEATKLASQLVTIAEHGYSSYTHPAVINGIKQLNDKLTAAVALSEAQA